MVMSYRARVGIFMREEGPHEGRLVQGRGAGVSPVCRGRAELVDTHCWRARREWGGMEGGDG